MPPVEGTVLQWNVSNAFDESALTGHHRLDEASLDGLTWSPLAAGSSGTTNLAHLACVSDDKNTVLARVTLRSARAQSVRVAFGYSDRVKAYANGNLVYGRHQRP